MDEKSDFKHKTILCMPIMHCNKPKRVLGLFQLVNKFDGLPFTKNDENFVQAFAIFCGMGINNVRMYEKTCLVMAKQQVTLEVLRYKWNIIHVYIFSLVIISRLKQFCMESLMHLFNHLQLSCYGSCRRSIEINQTKNSFRGGVTTKISCF